MVRSIILLALTSTLWIALGSCISPTTSNACSSVKAPLRVAIRNITLPNQFVKRGIAIQVGTPPQNLAFLPSTFHNNTFVYDATSGCDPSNTMPQCSAQHGGFFDSGASSTWDQASSYNALRLPVEADEGAYKDTWGTDQLVPNSSLKLSNFPIGIERINAPGFSLIGLGSNSTFVRALFDAGAIASKTWSLAWGWTGATTAHQMDGNMVFGGYDAAKSTGPNVTSPFTSHFQCPSRLMVTITDIVLNLKNGSNPSILGTGHGSALRACVDPSYPLITIPLDVYTSFVDIGGGTFWNRSVGNAIWGMNFAAKDVYDGDLSFRLSNDVNIRIPNHQLVLPDYSINALGQYQIGNNSVREVMVNSLQEINKDDLPLLGQSFMSSAYLSVDLDNEVFSLASYKPTTDTEIVPLAGSACRSAPPVTNTTIPPVVPAPAKKVAAPQDSSNAGMIAGAVVGAVAGTLILVGLGFLALRKRKQKKFQHYVAASVDRKVSDPRLSNPYFYNPELPSDKQPPQELPLERDQPASLPPYEMPLRKTPKAGHESTFLHEM